MLPQVFKIHFCECDQCALLNIFNYLCASFFSHSLNKLPGLLEYVYAGLWENVSLKFNSDFRVSTGCKAVFAVACFHNSSAQFFQTCVIF